MQMKFLPVVAAIAAFGSGAFAEAGGGSRVVGESLFFSRERGR